jgi:hypothetical protein
MRFFSALGGVFKGVHYNSDAEGLVVVVDCDDSVLHDQSHENLAGGSQDCRLCRIRNIIAKAKKYLKPRTGRPELKLAIGMTVPSVEAWYLAGKNHQVGEAAWMAALASGHRPFTRPQLKNLVYGTDRPSLELETKCAVREARRIISDLKVIETTFPIGFGLMAQQIRTWVTPTT